MAELFPTQHFPDIFDHGSLISHKELLFFKTEVGSLTWTDNYVQDGLEGVQRGNATKYQETVSPNGDTAMVNCTSETNRE